MHPAPFLRFAAALAVAVNLVVAATPPAATGVAHDLTALHDATRVLVNPHKGWYHHFPDNHPDKYRIARDADLLEFPGMDHVYLRLAWSYLEPREGQFDWAAIDRTIKKWTAHGLGIAFRISCKETSTDQIEQQYATPRWVQAAGAQGGHYRMGEVVGPGLADKDLGQADGAGGVSGLQKRHRLPQGRVGHGGCLRGRVRQRRRRCERSSGP